MKGKRKGREWSYGCMAPSNERFGTGGGKFVRGVGEEGEGEGEFEAEVDAVEEIYFGGRINSVEGNGNGEIE